MERTEIDFGSERMRGAARPCRPDDIRWQRGLVASIIGRAKENIRITLPPPRQKKTSYCNSFCSVPRRIAQQPQKLSDESEAHAGMPWSSTENRNPPIRPWTKEEMISSRISFKFTVSSATVYGVIFSFENDPRRIDMCKPWRVR